MVSVAHLQLGWAALHFTLVELYWRLGFFAERARLARVLLVWDPPSACVSTFDDAGTVADPSSSVSAGTVIVAAAAVRLRPRPPLPLPLPLPESGAATWASELELELALPLLDEVDAEADPGPTDSSVAGLDGDASASGCT